MRVVADRSELRSLLELAVGGAGREHDRYATVEFTHGVVAAQRVSMWVEDSSVVLGSWVGELKPQYSQFYSNPSAVGGLLALADRGWRVDANLHLAYFRCPPRQRWYPPMCLSGYDYAHRWMQDLSPAGRKPREMVAGPAFGKWLVDSGFVTADELTGLRDWMDGHSRHDIDIRPSMAVKWYWDEPRPSVPAVRRMVDEFLTAIREPALPPA
ncbi:hypothetical protein AB0M22_45155 [Nocardia sp. NPDC051756]|uniref:hypothetical protein n=1 Tax=Nocardia sp. NPDC051756 TaxID=3154751 RepID=UPI00344AC80D